MDSSSLLWGLLFSSIGLGYAMYGRRRRAVVPFLCGLALMAFPYFVENTLALLLVGSGLAVLPCFVRL